MYREPRSKVTEKENRRYVEFDNNTNEAIETIKNLTKTLFDNPFTDKGSNILIDCISDFYFHIHDNIAGFEDLLDNIVEFLEILLVYLSEDDTTD